MAVMHLTVKNGGKGRGSLHMGYITRTNRYKDYEDLVTTKSGNLPAWALDEKEFWLAADAYERANGRVYKELEISLPRELTRAQQIELVEKFTNDVLGNSFTYTWAIHAPKAMDGEENPHVHLMFSERKLDGIHRNKQQYFRRYNADHPERGGAMKERAFNNRAFVYTVRADWAATANIAMFMHGHTGRIDHRSYKEQGIDLVSQNFSRIFDHYNEEIEGNYSYNIKYDDPESRFKNGQRLIENPEIALKALTVNSSTFTETQVDRFMLTHTDGAEQYLAAYNALLDCPKLNELSHKLHRFTSDAMIESEQNILTMVERANQTISRDLSLGINPHSRIEQDMQFKEEQKIAFRVLTENTQISLLSGSAGTGKSYVLQGVNRAFSEKGYKVYGATIQNETAAMLQADTGIHSVTIARLLHRIDKENLENYPKNQWALNDKSVLVIDEAGMVGSKDMEKLLAYTEKTGAKLRLVGDSFQLNSIAAGSAFSHIEAKLAETDKCALRGIRRQKSTAHCFASREFAAHKIDQGLRVYQSEGSIYSVPTQAEARQKLVKDWAVNMDNSLMIAHTNNDVEALNRSARTEYRNTGRLTGEDRLLVTEYGSQYFAKGDKIMLTKNDSKLGLRNGMTAIVTGFSHDKEGSTTILASYQTKEDGIESRHKIEIPLKDYSAVRHGYATTIYKSQGVTVDNVFLLASDNMNANLTYVAATRHRDKLKIYTSEEQFKNHDAMVKTLSRKEDKTYTADFDVLQKKQKLNHSLEQRQSFALKHGFKQKEELKESFDHHSNYSM